MSPDSRSGVLAQSEAINESPLPLAIMKILCTVKLACALVIGGVTSAQSYTVVPLSVPGGRPQAIAPNGDVVGFYSAGSIVRAFLHDASVGAYSDVGVLPGAAHSAARGVNVVGQVVGSSWVTPIAQPGHAFLFTPGSGMQDLGVLSGPTSEAFCIDDLGNVGGQADGSAFTPEAMWVAAGGSMQSVVPGSAGNVLAASANGWVGGVLGNNQAFYQSPGSTTPSFVPLPTATPIGRVTAVAANGWMAGEMSDPSGSPSYAFRFFAPSGALDNLGSISRFGTVGGINSVGDVVATRQISIQSTPTALISIGGAQLVTLDSLVVSPGWSIRSATGFNERGQICGRAAFSGGANEPVRLDPVVSGAADASVVGGGCTSVVVRASPPRVGRIWSMGMRGAAAGQPLLSLLTLGHFAPAPLPGSACDVYLSAASPIFVTFFVANAAGSWADHFAVPDVPSIAGSQLTLQLLLGDASAPLGLVATEAVQATIGN